MGCWTNRLSLQICLIEFCRLGMSWEDPHWSSQSLESFSLLWGYRRGRFYLPRVYGRFDKCCIRLKVVRSRWSIRSARFRKDIWECSPLLGLHWQFFLFGRCLPDFVCWVEECWGNLVMKTRFSQILSDFSSYHWTAPNFEFATSLEERLGRVVDVLFSEWCFPSLHLLAREQTGSKCFAEWDLPCVLDFLPRSGVLDVRSLPWPEGVWVSFARGRIRLVFWTQEHVAQLQS